MRQTTNIHLKQPDYTDFADIEVLNENFEVIDREIKEAKDAATDVGSVELPELGTDNKELTGAINEINDKVTQHLEQIPEIQTLLNGKASTQTYIATIGIDWIEVSAPYTQLVHVEGILETDNPIISPVYSEDIETAIAQKEAWSVVSKAVTVNNGITFYCFEDKPIVPIHVQIKVVR